MKRIENKIILKMLKRVGQRSHVALRKLCSADLRWRLQSLADHRKPKLATKASLSNLLDMRSLTLRDKQFLWRVPVGALFTFTHTQTTTCPGSACGMQHPHNDHITRDCRLAVDVGVELRRWLEQTMSAPRPSAAQYDDDE
jgi:hypothetical protein